MCGSFSLANTCQRVEVWPGEPQNLNLASIRKCRMTGQCGTMTRPCWPSPLPTVLWRPTGHVILGKDGTAWGDLGSCSHCRNSTFYLSVCVSTCDLDSFSQHMSWSFILPLFERPVQFSCECYRLYSMKVKCLADFLKWKMPVQHPLSLKLMLCVFDSHQAGDNLCSFTAFIHLLRIWWTFWNLSVCAYPQSPACVLRGSQTPRNPTTDSS